MLKINVLLMLLFLEEEMTMHGLIQFSSWLASPIAELLWLLLHKSTTTTPEQLLEEEERIWQEVKDVHGQASALKM